MIAFVAQVQVLTKKDDIFQDYSLVEGLLSSRRVRKKVRRRRENDLFTILAFTFGLRAPDFLNLLLMLVLINIVKEFFEGVSIISFSNTHQPFLLYV